jgi:hypothetical protein
LRSTYTSLSRWHAEAGWRATAGRRAGAIGLTIVAELVFLLLLLGLNPTITGKPQEKASPIAFDLSPAAPRAAPHPSVKRREVAERRPAPQRPAPPAAPKLP